MLITQDDIQRIGDEAALLHFLEEKLNLPIPEGSALEDITIKFGKLALGLTGAVANQVLDCQELIVSPGQPSGIFLIRFNSESDYTEALRAVATGLDKPGRNPVDLRFICMNECFQPFAFAHFNDLKSGNWDKAVLTVFTWIQSHTRINTGSEHDLSTLFPLRKTNDLNRSKTLLTKLQKIGTPLGKNENIHSGIGLKYKAAFVIDDATAKQLIADDWRSEELIKTFPDEYRKWKWESKHIIYIPSSKNKEWPWSGITDERKAEQVFTKEYPAISKRMKQRKYKDKLKKGKKACSILLGVPAIWNV